MATMRNEGPFLLEWVAYHRIIGFTEVVICSNDCVDGSPELLDALQNHGLLHHLRCSPTADDQPQLFAYAAAERHLRDDWPDVLMVLDADEFLNIHVGFGTVSDLLEVVPLATSILLNWRIFGNSGHKRWLPELVIRRFVQAASQDHGVNRSFKTLFTSPRAYHCPLLPHGPGFAKEDAVSQLVAVDGAGAVLDNRYTRMETFLQTDPGLVRWDLGQINHYNTRSWEDYVSKHDRGGGLGGERWNRDENWAAFNRNEEEDVSIQRHLPSLVAHVEELLLISEVRGAYERSLTLYRRHVDQLNSELA